MQALLSQLCNPSHSSLSASLLWHTKLGDSLFSHDFLCSWLRFLKNTQKVNSSELKTNLEDNMFKICLLIYLRDVIVVVNCITIFTQK